MKRLNYIYATMIGLMAMMFSSVASADLVADATTKIGELQTSAESLGTPILGIVAAIVLISIIVMLVKRAR